MRAKTNALAALIGDHAADALATLQNRARTLGVELRPDLELGSSDAAPAEDRARDVFRIELAQTALRIALDRTQPNLGRLRARLASAKLIRLYGGIAALILSSGMVGAVLGEHRALAIVAAVLNFAAAVATLIAQHRETSLYGGSTSLVDAFESIIEISTQAETLMDRLAVMARSSPDAAALEAVLAEANSVAVELRRWEKLLWGTRPVSREQGSPRLVPLEHT